MNNMGLWKMVGLVALGAVGALIIKNMMHTSCSCNKGTTVPVVPVTTPITTGTTTTVVAPVI